MGFKVAPDNESTFNLFPPLGHAIPHIKHTQKRKPLLTYILLLKL